MPRITVEQKLQLRGWFNSQPSKPSQSEAITWFKHKFDITLPQYQISRILRSNTLDFVNLNSPGLQHTRVSSAQWPVLEDILQRWQYGMEVRGINTSREVLMEKARYIWTHYPEARNGLPPENPPSFGPRWCRLFQKRFPASGAKASAEAVNVPEARPKMAHLKRVVSETPRGNRYNMDQIGLLWRLSASPEPVRELEKTRISIAITTNDTGDDKLDLWVVGKATCPRALKNFNWKAHNIVWRHNRKAWFSTSIMNEWLKAFYQHIQTNKPGQKVLLLLDNFKPHLVAVNETPPPPNITIEFIPPNVTSMYQPNEQGIVSLLKAHFRRSCLVWMCGQISDGCSEDPMSRMNLRLAMMWLSTHWFLTLTPEAIQKCWQKSKLLGVVTSNYKVLALPHDLCPLYNNATIGFADKKPLSTFLEPADEDTPPTEPSTDLEVLDQVLDEWSLQPDYRDAEEIAEEASQTEPASTTLQDGLASLKKVIALVESHDTFTNLELQGLLRVKQSMTKLLQESEK